MAYISSLKEVTSYQPLQRKLLRAVCINSKNCFQSCKHMYLYLGKLRRYSLPRQILSVLVQISYMHFGLLIQNISNISSALSCFDL